MITFKDMFMNEEISHDYSGLTVDGELLTVDIRRARKNDVMEITVKGNRILSKLKSADNVKDDYSEKDWVKIEKIWDSVFEKYSSDVNDVIKKFEKDINNIIINMEKDTSKY